MIIRKGDRQVRIEWHGPRIEGERVMILEQERAGTHIPFRYSEAKKMINMARQYLMEGIRKTIV